MQTHDKIRMDILIEAPARDRLSAFLDRQGVSGYTLFSAIGGKGGGHAWARAGLITDVGQMTLFVCILDRDRRETVLDALYDSFRDHIGFVTTSDVQVIRPDKFP
jgi:hypothetical protein